LVPKKLVLLVPVVSKSLFILLYAVTLLSVVASLQFGDLRSGEKNFSPSAELRADIASFRGDMRLLVRRANDVPLSFHVIWEDARQDFRTIKADAAAEAKNAGHRISILIRTNA
jgi:hypothetical protein